MGRKWTKKEIQILQKLYPDTLTKIVAESIGRPLHSVYNKARALGLSKSEAFLNSEASGRIKPDSGKAYRFKPGHLPANKGKKMSAELKEKVKHTFFKTGHLPHNTKHDGCISVRKDKRGVPYQFIRIELAKWIPLHHHFWSEANGNIPKGKLIIFLDGNTMNANINNLKMISKSDNMKRNSLYNYPKDIQDALRTIGVLTRKINKDERRNTSKK